MDKAKYLIDLANFRLARWTDRRKHEWAISAGLWVALGGVALSGKIAKIDQTYLAIMLVAFILAHAIFWVRFNLTRNQRDLREAFNYISQAHATLQIESPPGPPEDSSIKKWVKKCCPKLEFLAEAPCLFQILISLLVAVFVFLNHGAS